MVLKFAGVLFSTLFPTQYLVHIVITVATILVLHAFAQGRKTNRERDLHARVVLVTGAFTPLGLMILQSLAQRGAHIIALSPHPIDSPRVTIMITLLRSTTGNEQIFAEQCDLTSPSSIRTFCTRFLTGKDQRIDAVLFVHEYQHIGSLGFLSHKGVSEDARKQRDAGSLATFLITTLLLPALLVAPVERDIRIITVVNPFYAAAAGPSFLIPFSPHSPISSKVQSKSIFLLEGIRSLRTSIFTRHLQRILDALPTTQVPKTDDTTSTVSVVSQKIQKSNIVAVSVSPGISRVDTIAPLLNANWTLSSGSSVTGIMLYTTLQPLLRIFTKSPIASIQTVLHVVFLPTPFKVLSQGMLQPKADELKGYKGSEPVNTAPEEMLRPGALYADCAVVRLRVTIPEGAEQTVSKKGQKKDTGKRKAEEQSESGVKEILQIEDDDEFGGEVLGRLVWEAYEEALKTWEKAGPTGEQTSKQVVSDVGQD